MKIFLSLVLIFLIGANDLSLCQPNNSTCQDSILAIIGSDKKGKDSLKINEKKTTSEIKNNTDSLKIETINESENKTIKKEKRIAIIVGVVFGVVFLAHYIVWRETKDYE